MKLKHTASNRRVSLDVLDLGSSREEAHGVTLQMEAVGFKYTEPRTSTKRNSANGGSFVGFTDTRTSRNSTGGLNFAYW